MFLLFAVRPAQSRELQARLWHRLRHLVMPSVHLSDPGGVGAGRGGGRGGQRAGHSHGGLRRLLPGLPGVLLPRHLPGVQRTGRRVEGRADEGADVI